MQARERATARVIGLGILAALVLAPTVATPAAAAQSHAATAAREAAAASAHRLQPRSPGTAGQAAPAGPAPATPAPPMPPGPAAPLAQGAEAGAAQTPQSGPTPAAQPEAYTYNPDGRRDPFVGLLSRGIEPAAPGRRTDGVASLTVAELSVKGILHSRGAYVAMVQGPDSKTYIVHANDRLHDGTIKTITAQALVIIQDVNDPLSLVKHREVRKSLRALEEGK